MRVLIVDDNETELAVLDHILQAAGYEVERAANGREALTAVQAGCRLVVSDQCMPVMDGTDFCREVRSQSLPGYVYVIMLTARASLDGCIASLSAGADDYLCKPFDHRELLARLRTGERVLALESREVTIFALAKLAESRDPETGAHLERVRSYSRVLAERLATSPECSDEINPDFLRLIYLTSPLHDIGKVGIPDAVLLKPGRLNDREFEVMKRHTIIGADTLDAALRVHPNAAYLRMARDIAAAHHERYDGSGYPYGLSGREIPLSARIVALADVYDALTTKRVYKDAFEHMRARAIIEGDAGKHFDPVVVEAFVDRESEFLRILSAFNESVADAA
jgi:putative two-component system response regulator